MPARKPFPQELFDDRLDSNGFWNEIEVNLDRGRYNQSKSIPVLATAQCSNEIGDSLDTLHREAKRIKIAKIHRFRESGLESDEYEEALEKLIEFKDNYDECFEL